MDCNDAEGPTAVREKDLMVLESNEKLEYLKPRFGIQSFFALIHDQTAQ